MKKYIFTLITLFCVLFQTHAGNDFNPTNPPEPGNKKYFKLALSCYPANAANVYGSGNIEQGTPAYVYAYANSGMQFVGWKKGDQIVSSYSHFYYTPEEDTELVAYYEFAPSSPSEPNPENPKYWLNIAVTPQNGGYTNITSGKHIAESSVYLYAYTYTGFVFKGWSINGETVCTTNSFYFTMTHKDVTVVANYSYEPGSPSEPDSEIKSACYLLAPEMEAYNGSTIAYPVSVTNFNYTVNALSFETSLPQGVTVENVEPTGRLNNFNTEWRCEDGKLRFTATSQSNELTGMEGNICFVVMKLPSHWKEGESYPVNFDAITVNGTEPLNTVSGKLNILSNGITSIGNASSAVEELIFTNDRVRYTGTGNVRFELYSISGKAVFSTSETDSFSTSDMPKGIYLVKAVTEKGLLVKKIIIR